MTEMPAGSRRTISIGPAAGTSPASRTRRYQPVRPEPRNRDWMSALPPVERELEAGPAWLADLKACCPPRPHVADAHVGLQDSSGREVLAEWCRAEVSSELLAPRPEVFGWIGVHGLVRATVHAQIGLAVARQVERRQPEHGRQIDRTLADAAPHVVPAHRGENRRHAHAHSCELDHGVPHGAGAHVSSVPVRRRFDEGGQRLAFLYDVGGQHPTRLGTQVEGIVRSSGRDEEAVAGVEHER